MLPTLEMYGLNVDNWRDQSSKSTANIWGAYSGLQTRVKEKTSDIFYYLYNTFTDCLKIRWL